MDVRAGGACGWIVILRLVVLALAGMVGVPRGNGWTCTLEMAGCGSIRSRICRRATLRLGFRMDRARNACALHSSAETSCCGLLSLRPQSDVCRVCHRMDRPLDRFRARYRDAGCSGRRGSTGCPSLRPFLRRANFAFEVRRGLRRLLPQRTALEATPATLDSTFAST